MLIVVLKVTKISKYTQNKLNMMLFWAIRFITKQGTIKVDKKSNIFKLVDIINGYPLSQLLCVLTYDNLFHCLYPATPTQPFLQTFPLFYSKGLQSQFYFSGLHKFCCLINISNHCYNVSPIMYNEWKSIASHFCHLWHFPL